jgi:Ca2+/H+ antiporter, TMEM165/GDT1 family
VTAFLTAFGLIFIAELGDKTQFMTLAFATRYRSLIVLTGVSIASLLVSLVSVALGETLGKLLPVFWVNLVAGLGFIVFGVLELRSEDESEVAISEDKKDQNKEKKVNPLITISAAFFLAELGDKTMLATVAIATEQHQFVEVWLGASLGLISSNALAIVAGKAVGEKLSAHTIKMAIAAVYIISGIAAISQALLNRV